MSLAPVRAATRNDAPAIVATLAHAFDRDPAFNYGIRDDDKRARAQQLAWSTLFARFIRYELSFVVNEGQGVALWCKHTQVVETWWRELMLLPAYIRCCGLDRTPRVITAFERMKAKHPKPAHLYLFALGVAPEAQGQGLGSRLLAHTLESCDRTQMPAYLEATTPVNKALYLRHGFEVTCEFPLGDGGPSLTGMWREPVRRG